MTTLFPALDCPQTTSVDWVPGHGAVPAARVGGTVIESLGIYLPPRAVSTAEVLRGCDRPVAFPLERATGIRARRMAGDGEYAIDLARKAVADCLASSRYAPADIDLLVCCSVSRCDGPGHRFTFEPCTAQTLRRELGFDRALAFDLSNACAGMFTAIYLIDALIQAGMIRRGMAVSGEYLTHVTRTAQHEIDAYFDPRLSCLTVGDAGAAVILERADGPGAGFEAVDLYTLGAHARHCVARATLPDRLRRKAAGRPARPAPRRAPAPPEVQRPRVGIRIESLGIPPESVSVGVDTLGLLRAAAEDCLGQSGYARSDIDLFLFTGVYRSQFLSEPAVAALAAGELGINGDVATPDGPRTFAFDVVNGGLGFLNACHLAAGLIGAGKHRVAMVTASEVENNRPGGPAGLTGVLETGAAVILDASPDSGRGFGAFLFKSYPEHAGKLSAYTGMAGGDLVMHVERDARLGEVYRECIFDAMQELLMAEGLSIDDVDVILPPQVAPGFVADLARGLGAESARCVDIAVEGKDYLSSSLVHAMRHALDRGMAKSGDLGLTIVVGSGIQVGCALCRF